MKNEQAIDVEYLQKVAVQFIRELVAFIFGFVIVGLSFTLIFENHELFTNKHATLWHHEQFVNFILYFAFVMCGFRLICRLREDKSSVES